MKKLLILRSIERMKQWYEMQHEEMLNREIDHLVRLLGDYYESQATI